MADGARRVAAHRENQRDVTYPAPKNYTARKRAEKNLLTWLKRYFPEAFNLPWANFHKICIKKIQLAFTTGGWFSVALPRGTGKTTIATAAALWAVLTGHKRFFLLVCATGGKAEKLMKNLKSSLRFNEKLYADYPEICGPIRALKGVTMRAHAQTAYGKPTMIDMSAGRIVLPDTKIRTKKGTWLDSPGAGAIISACGITGDVRGAQETKPDGTVLRPDAALIDDPQTRESAKSKEQTGFRLDVITGDVAGSEGVIEPISIVATVTVIRKGDLSDQILDRDLYPDFVGECHSLIKKWPKNMDLWDKYNEARKKGLDEEDKGKRCRAFYRKHRKRLDAGAIITWKHRKVGRLSGLQYAMDKFFQLGKERFSSEYQNKPESDQTLYTLDEKIIMSRFNGLRRLDCPADAKTITAFIDINRIGLHWALCGFSHPFTTYVLDYGKWPKRGPAWEQNANIVERQKAIHTNLTELVEHIKAISITRDNAPALINLVMIDRGYEPDPIHKWLQFAKTPFEMQASWGVAHHKYYPTHKSVIPNSIRDACHRAEAKSRQFLVFDACVWREFTQRGFLSKPGEPGSVSLYGRKPLEHKVFAEHIMNEMLSDIAIGDRGKVYRWATLPGPHDYLDALVGCLVGAAHLGFTQSGEQEQHFVVKRRRRRSR